MASIELNAQFQEALELMEQTEQNVFITGKAGTGKSTLLSYFRDHTQKAVVVLAPTGVAALNIQGQTIHSFFRFKPTITLEDAKKSAKNIRNPELYREIVAIIIDEISMVRADLLDCIDLFLRTVLKRKQPFGGIQMIWIGDLYQLPPVVTGDEKEYFRKVYPTPYFFSANVMQDPSFQLNFIELEKIYRQSDATFIELLNAIRNRSATETHLKKLNTRVRPDIQEDEGYLHLTTTNRKAETINHEKLNRLPTKSHTYEAIVSGDFDLKMAPTDLTLKLKVGAQVMLLTNHSMGAWVNGTIGQVLAIKNDPEADDSIVVKTRDGNTVDVLPHKWPLYRYQFQKETRKLTQEKMGSFTQYPIKLAWAITIHKSQGKTFDKVVIDLERGSFAHGQTYVALSRTRSFEGIILKYPLKLSHILMDYQVVKFLTRFQYQLSEARCSIEEKTRLLQTAIQEKSPLEILYLKTNDEKSRRTILPTYLGEMEYLGKHFLGVEAFCQTRKDNRVFRIDRILEMKQKA